MHRLACQPRSRCAAWLAAALALVGIYLLTIQGAILADESIGRFPVQIEDVADPVISPDVVDGPLVVAPPATSSEPLIIEGPDTPRYGWPGTATHTAEFDIAPPTCACPDCGGHGDYGHRGLLSHFYGWDAAGEYVAHDNPDDPARHIGKGQPLFGTSWRNRPHYTAVMLGGVIADGPLEPFAEHTNSGLVSLNQGCDFDHFWGGEMRLAVGQFGLEGDSEHENDVYYIDAHLSYYPWGDARFRPYVASGLGFMGNNFVDNRDLQFDELLLTIPLSLGLKYQVQPHYAIRFDLTQNISFGSGNLDTMDNISLSAGVEWHYGGAGKSYFPWNAGVYER